MDYARHLLLQVAQRLDRLTFKLRGLSAYGAPQKDVHTEHCCLRHGCKYGDIDECTVVLGIRVQSYFCELCDEEDRHAIVGRIYDCEDCVGGYALVDGKRQPCPYCIVTERDHKVFGWMQNRLRRVK
jgi:hypothetical protein